jgi:hypothetical protein
VAEYERGAHNKVRNLAVLQVMDVGAWAAAAKLLMCADSCRRARGQLARSREQRQRVGAALALRAQTHRRCQQRAWRCERGHAAA